MPKKQFRVNGSKADKADFVKELKKMKWKINSYTMNHILKDGIGISISRITEEVTGVNVDKDIVYNLPEDHDSAIDTFLKWNEPEEEVVNQSGVIIGDGKMTEEEILKKHMPFPDCLDVMSPKIWACILDAMREFYAQSMLPKGAEGYTFSFKDDGVFYHLMGDEVSVGKISSICAKLNSKNDE